MKWMLKSLSLPFLIVVIYVCSASGFLSDSSPCNMKLPRISLDCELILDQQEDEGFTIRYYPNKKDKLSEGHFKEGIVTGFWKFFYENGKVHWEGNYTNGQLDGFFTLFFENGRVQEKGHYENCVRDGYWNFYFDNRKNQVQFQGHFENGNPVGTWQEFDSSGKLQSQFECS